MTNETLALSFATDSRLLTSAFRLVGSWVDGRIEGFHKGQGLATSAVRNTNRSCPIPCTNGPIKLRFLWSVKWKPKKTQMGMGQNQ